VTEKIEKLIQLARLAPSVHNTQPWRVLVKDNTLNVSVHEPSVLDHGDPTLRELWLSVGCFMYCLEQISPECGLQLTPLETQTSNLSSVVCTYTIKQIEPTAPKISILLQTRRSDRRLYAKDPLSKKNKSLLQSLICPEGTAVSVVDDKVILAKAASLTATGLRMAFSMPDFRKELSDLIIATNSRQNTGLYYYALNRTRVGGWMEKLSIRTGINTQKLVQNDYDRILNSSALVFILSDGDTPKYWTSAGKTYMAASIKIEDLGLAQSTTAALVEAGDLHEEIENLIGTKNRIQAVIRIGTPRHNGRPKRTPRLSVSEIST